MRCGSVCCAVWLGLSLTVGAFATLIGPLDGTSYSNVNPQIIGLFRDVLDPTYINSGPDFGGTGQTSINFNRGANAGGASALTVYDTDPSTLTPTLFQGSIVLSGDFLSGTFNNYKAPGLLALFNEGLGQQGLALLLADNGNTDRMQLYSVTQSGMAGAGLLASGTLTGGPIGEGAWYRLVMDVAVSGGSVTVTGQTFGHSTSTDPNSGLGPQIGSDLIYTNTLAALGLDANAIGEVGLVFRNVSSEGNQSSATSFLTEGELAVPEPGTFLLFGFGLLSLRVFKPKRRGA